MAQDRGPPRVVRVARPAAIEAAREGLPIVGMEQEVMEAVNGSDVVLLCGETGCGKTTQANREPLWSSLHHALDMQRRNLLCSLLPNVLQASPQPASWTILRRYLRAGGASHCLLRQQDSTPLQEPLN